MASAKVCSCGAEFSAADFRALPALPGPKIAAPADWSECDCADRLARLRRVLATPALSDGHLRDCAGRGFTIELVNCTVCGSTLAREIESGA